MQFPQRDAMTEEQKKLNEEASRELICGKYYRFTPPSKSTAVPVGGPNVCELADCDFDRGWYIGFIEDNHVFQGKPVNDERVMFKQKGYKDNELDSLRESYFHVLFIGGSKVELDVNQKP